MSDYHHLDKVPGNSPPFLKTPAGWVMIAFLAIGGFYLITEHTAHLFGVLPFAFLFACPLMHLFMHHGGGHSHGDGHGHGDGAADDSPKTDMNLSSKKDAQP